MTTITATASSTDTHAALARLQTYRRQLAQDLIPVQADAQTITADRASVAAAETEVARLAGLSSANSGKVASAAVQAESDAAVAKAQSAPAAKKDLPFGRSLDVTV